MTILSQLRDEASKAVESKTLAIIQMAINELARNRYERLRKRTTYPMDDQERAYMGALGMYVKYKRLSEKAHNQNFYAHYSDRFYYESQRDVYRRQMDRIELGNYAELIGEPGASKSGLYYLWGPREETKNHV